MASNVASAAPSGTLALETISDAEAFARLEPEWDDLVRAMRRPAPLLLHGWLREWWAHYGGGGKLAVHVATRDGRLVGALPLCVRRSHGLRVLSFLGGRHSALADVLVAPGEEDVAADLARRAAGTKHDYADLFGLPGGSRLVEELNGVGFRLIERVEAPIVDLEPGWDAVYHDKMSAKRQREHRRRMRNLANLGRLELSTARTPDEVRPALEDAFELHELRWNGRPDGSEFTTPLGRRFHRAAMAALAERDVVRIVSMTIDGRPVAFHLFFALASRMYFFRLGFDPAFGRNSPGILTTHASIEVGAAEGARLVEFLGGTERYKIELADRFDPLYEGFGLERSPQGRLAVQAHLAAIRARRRLKRSELLRHAYFDGLAPVRRLRGRLS